VRRKLLDHERVGSLQILDLFAAVVGIDRCSLLLLSQLEILLRQSFISFYQI
jgi:hypothetical protein